MHFRSVLYPYDKALFFQIKDCRFDHYKVDTITLNDHPLKPDFLVQAHTRDTTAEITSNKLLINIEYRC
jgi:hypothetical protein